MTSRDFFYATAIVFILTLAVWIGYGYGLKKGRSEGLNPIAIVKKSKGFTRKAPKKLQEFKTPNQNTEVEETPHPPDSLGSVDEKIGDWDAEMSKEERLAREIVFAFTELPESELSDIDKNIQTAEELIAIDPDYYAAYKFKLINLLTKEIRFKQEVDIQVYEDLYDQLLSFSGADENDEILNEMTEENLGNVGLSANEIDGVDKDLLHIPFLRLAALGEYEHLGALAEDYLQEYPESYLGFFYSAEALWKVGDHVEAAKVLKESLRIEESDDMILQMFSKFQKNPMQRIQGMSLQ